MNDRSKIMDEIANSMALDLPIEYGFVEGLETMLFETLAEMEIPVAVFLNNGIRLAGIIVYHSDRSISIRGASDCVVMLSSVASVTIPANGSKINVIAKGDDSMSVVVETSGPRKWNQ